jgi:hypothetical protein
VLDSDEEEEEESDDDDESNLPKVVNKEKVAMKVKAKGKTPAANPKAKGKVSLIPIIFGLY